MNLVCVFSSCFLVFVLIISVDLERDVRETTHLYVCEHTSHMCDSCIDNFDTMLVRLLSVTFWNVCSTNFNTLMVCIHTNNMHTPIICIFTQNMYVQPVTCINK